MGLLFFYLSVFLRRVIFIEINGVELFELLVVFFRWDVFGKIKFLYVFVVFFGWLIWGFVVNWREDVNDSLLFGGI